MKARGGNAEGNSPPTDRRERGRRESLVVEERVHTVLVTLVIASFGS